MSLTGHVLAGRYRLLEAIGQGGMAVVHRAHDQLLDRDVAVKLLRPAYASDPDFVTRFRREARHAASLHHPNVVTIHDTGVDPDSGSDYIVMQFVDGPDLQTVLLKEGRLPLGQALRIGLQTTKALQAAHEQGIVHRDVKPGNILIDHDGEVRVADFGIARAVRDATATTSGLLLGSPEYASPEQVMGQPITPASDIYSLGVVLYEVITGWRPFSGDSPAAIALERLRVRPAPPSSIVPYLSPEIDDIILTAMADDPADRYPSAADLGVALERFRVRELGGVRRTGARLRGVITAPGGTTGTARVIAANDRVAGARHVGPASDALDQDVAALSADPVAGPDDQSVTVRHPIPDPSAVTARHAITTTDRADWAAEGWQPGTDRDEDRGATRRRVVPLALALPLGALALVVLVGVAVLGGVGGRDGGRAALGTSSASPDNVAVAPMAEPSASVSLAPSVVGTPTVAPTPVPAVAASPTPLPTEVPTPAPSPAPTAPPPPDPTVRPTDGPGGATTAPARDPAQTVAHFYDLVVDGKFDEAARLWTARMREEYPPKGYIDGRFGPTTRIDIERLTIRSSARDGKTAVVFVDLVEYRTSGSPRRFVGTWDLVLRSTGWLMDEPHF